jgi:PAS domain S-box-containing protein
MDMTYFDYQTLFETLPEGVFSIDRKFRITSFNHTAERISGFSRHDVMGRYCWEIFRSNRCRKNCPLSRALDTGETRMDQEVTTFNANGERQLLLVNVNVVKDGQGSPVGAVETFRSVRLDDTSSLSVSTWDQGLTGIVGKSTVMHSVMSRLADVAATEANVLISGESGTGKELLAQAIHRFSHFRKGPFAAVNCASLAESLLESELFGHEKGAFTGADRDKPGRFELARGGTLFLDEIGEMKPGLQVKLLRVIEQKVFERVGGTTSIPLHARIISATNQDLKKARLEGRFREDLYYRLRTVPLVLPPLRDRREDIPLLIDHFIKKLNTKYHKRVRSVDPKAVKRLSRYHWPGNVRELERCLEYAFVFVKGPVIFNHYLPELEDELQPASETARIADFPGGQKQPLDGTAIRRALQQCEGRRQEAADLLGISRTSMWRYMKKQGLI